MKNIIKTSNSIIYLFMFCFLLNGCAPKASTAPISRTELFFDTVITITVYDSDDTEILDDCMELCSKYENLFSKTISSGDIGVINSSETEQTTVSSDTIELLKYSEKYYQLSNGKLDVAIGTLTDLWKASFDTNKPPDKAEINEALKHTGFDKITYDSSSLSLYKNDSKIKLDLGGIAKGYIGDKLKEYLISRNVHSALINLGGNIVAVGKKGDSNFHIGIKKPFSNVPDETIADLEICNTSVVTSGIYERYFEYEGKLYHHILSKDTGYPVESDLCSASIITENSTTADALSTTCILLGSKNALSLIESIDDTEAIFYTTDNQIIKTSGADKYIAK